MRPPSLLHGHLWTIGPYLRHVVAPTPIPPSRHWSTTVEDPRLGPVRLSGRLHEEASRTNLLVIVHGLGGSSASHYVLEATRAAHEAGWSSLRVNLRGADRSGEDYYHAGLTDDLRGALASPEVAPYAHIHLLGFSMGGHIALRYASEDTDPRVRAVAAVCPPLDLERSARAIDTRARMLYRRHVLGGLKQMYAEVARRRPVPIPLREAMRIDTFAQWDQHVVAPRHGFADARDYWRRMSVAAVLPHLRLPALAVMARHDPMVTESTVRPVLERSERLRTVWTDRGGHVGFPATLDLGLGGSGTVAAQLVGWLARAA